MRKPHARPTPAEPAASHHPDDILPEYDLSRSRPNPYAARAVTGNAMAPRSNVAIACPDTGEASPEAE